MARFIPVCTGNIINRRSASAIRSVYPCVYREHLQTPFIENIERGLSLCVQGTSLTLGDIDAVERFIPVHTGNI